MKRCGVLMHESPSNQAREMAEIVADIIEEMTGKNRSATARGEAKY